MTQQRLDVRQTDAEGNWEPWEIAEGDLLDKMVEAAALAHEYEIGDTVRAVLFTAWDGSQVEYAMIGEEDAE